MVFLTIRILVFQTDLSVEGWSLGCSLEFDENQPADCIDSISMDLNLRREARLHLSNSPLLSCGFFLILFYFIRIWCPEYLNSSDIIRLDIKLNVAGWREKSEIKSLKNILLDVFLVNCAEIVGSFDILEYLASWGLEVRWDAANWSVNVMKISSLLDDGSLFWDSLVTDISKHDDSVLTLIAFMFFDPFL